MIFAGDCAHYFAWHLKDALDGQSDQAPGPTGLLLVLALLFFMKYSQFFLSQHRGLSVGLDCRELEYSYRLAYLSLDVDLYLLAVLLIKPRVESVFLFLV